MFPEILELNLRIMQFYLFRSCRGESRELKQNQNWVILEVDTHDMRISQICNCWDNLVVIHVEMAE